MGELRRARVDPVVAAEFPELGLHYRTVEAGSGRSPAGVKERLGILSDRFGGAQALVLRNKPIPWAYRVFFRHIGLDPDEQRTPVEQLALERMQHGRFRSRNLLDDAITIATVESGVALLALDADRTGPELVLRAAAAGEELEGRPGALGQGSLVIADDERPLALLFGPIAERRGVHPDTRRTTLAAIAVKGVPAIAVEEAVWLAAEIIGDGPG